jgi:hypothetical protein
MTDEAALSFYERQQILVDLVLVRRALAVPELFFSRSAAGFCDKERGQVVNGGTASGHAAQVLPDDTALHQHGETDE